MKKKLQKKTRALLIPNLIGNLPNWAKIRKLANKHKLMIIEDSADTLGATIGNKPSGRFSDISITSFYGSHIISCAGNGGMFLTNNKNYAPNKWFDPLSIPDKKNKYFKEYQEFFLLKLEEQNIKNIYIVGKDKLEIFLTVFENQKCFKMHNLNEISIKLDITNCFKSF